MKLLGKAMENSSDRFANEDKMEALCACFMVMQIVTDKHKILIPLNYYEYWKPNEAIRGIGWTSYELMEKLKQWYPERTQMPVPEPSRK